MKKEYFKLIVAFGVAFIIGFCFGNGNRAAKYNQRNIPYDSNVNIKLSERKPKISDVTDSDAEGIEKSIAIFEDYKFNKDFVGAINQITPPQNENERKWLDHFIGNDLSNINNDRPFSRFSNKVNYHLLVGYEIEEISKKDKNFYAEVKELRVVDEASEGSPPEYNTYIQNVTFQILGNQGDYKISKYYHSKPTSEVDLKYEGFVAF